MDFAHALRDADGGPLVFARADRGEVSHETSPHSHARGQLIGCERGVITVGTEVGTWVVPSRHAVWLPPHHEHSGRTNGPFSGWSLYVAKPACAALHAQTCTLPVSPLLREAALRSAAWGLRELDAPSLHIAQVIVDEIARAKPQPLGLAMPRDERLVKVARALLENPADARGLDAWARFAGVSSRTLGRRFVAETSLTFTEWCQRARLLRGLELLAAETPVTTVAFELGYRSISAFSALFKRTFGVTPSAYFA
ncbi:MAG TPA: helix-turn-helix transcriptional regulator [Kofleriaceae bacterium]|jgi:AraC-like DNA-binding protein